MLYQNPTNKRFKLMTTSLPKGYSFIKATNSHVEIVKEIIFGVLEEYGLVPDNPELDGELEIIEEYKKSVFIEMKSPKSGPRCDIAFYKNLY